MNKPFGLMIAFIFVFLFQSAAAQAATSVFVNPAHTDTNLGDSPSIDVDISSTDDVYAVEFELHYDNTKLDGVGISEGGYLQSDGNSTFCYNSVDQANGKVIYACTRMGPIPGISGSGTLLTVVFDTLSYGTTALTLTNVNLLDSVLSGITTTVTDGTARVNRVPVASSVQISPAVPVSTDILVGSYSYSDPDGDSESGTEIEWYLNTAHIPGFDGLLSIPAAALWRGDDWYFTVRPSDGIGQGALVTSSTVTVLNSLPTAPGVDVTPDSPFTTDDLTCIIATASTDADGDPVSYTLAWYKDSVLQASQTTGTVSSSLTAKGETWKCVATPNDGTGDGPTGEDQVTIQNTAPTAPVVDVTPDSPTTADDLDCGIATPSTDADGDSISYSYVWSKDTVVQGALTTSTVLSSLTSRGEVWKCEVTATDGTATSPSDSDQVTVGNSPPTAPTVDVTPDLPVSTDGLTCTPTGSTDPDGDSVTYFYTWYKNTVIQFSQTTSTIHFSLTSRGDIWRCVATPNDGALDGPTGEDSVTVQNLAPTIDSINPAASSLETREGYSLQFDHISSDPDGDPLTYSWEIYGKTYSTGAAWLFQPNNTQCGSLPIDLIVSDGLLTDSAAWTVEVSLNGDVNLDDVVSLIDLATVGLAYGSTPSDSNWNEDADVHTGPGSDGSAEGNGKINIFDLATVGLNYGRSCASS